MGDTSRVVPSSWAIGNGSRSLESNGHATEERSRTAMARIGEFCGGAATHGRGKSARTGETGDNGGGDAPEPTRSAREPATGREAAARDETVITEGTASCASRSGTPETASGHHPSARRRSTLPHLRWLWHSASLHGRKQSGEVATQSPEHIATVRAIRPPIMDPAMGRSWRRPGIGEQRPGIGGRDPLATTLSPHAAGERGNDELLHDAAALKVSIRHYRGAIVSSSSLANLPIVNAAPKSNLLMAMNTAAFASGRRRYMSCYSGNKWRLRGRHEHRDRAIADHRQAALVRGKSRLPPWTPRTITSRLLVDWANSSSSPRPRERHQESPERVSPWHAISVRLTGLLGVASSESGNAEPGGRCAGFRITRTAPPGAAPACRTAPFSGWRDAPGAQAAGSRARQGTTPGGERSGDHARGRAGWV
jgi:hypothetical protein